jgi:hypothetical protein
MKPDLKTYGEKLLSRDSKVRMAAIHELAQSKHKKEVEFLIATVFKKRIANGVVLALKAIGNSGNKHAIQPLIDGYGYGNHEERELMMDCLLKLGVFDNFFPGDQDSKKIRERLWPVLFALNSDKLKKLLALSPKEFEAKAEFAWRMTKHWRK